MGRKPKDKSAEAKTTSKKKRDNETLATLAEIEAKLVKKAKANGGQIEQSDIYDALNNYELEDDVIEDLIEYFHKQNIEVVNEEEEDMDQNDEIEFDESKMLEDDDDDDFFAEDLDSTEEEEDLDFDIDHLDTALSGEVKVNDSVKMYLKEIGPSQILGLKILKALIRATMCNVLSCAGLFLSKIRQPTDLSFIAVMAMHAIQE